MTNRTPEQAYGKAPNGFDSLEILIESSQILSIILENTSLDRQQMISSLRSSVDNIKKDIQNHLHDYEEKIKELQHNSQKCSVNFSDPRAAREVIEIIYCLGYELGYQKVNINDIINMCIEKDIIPQLFIRLPNQDLLTAYERVRSFYYAVFFNGFLKRKQSRNLENLFAEFEL